MNLVARGTAKHTKLPPSYGMNQHYHSSASVPRKKFRLGELAARMILCLGLLWFCVSCMFFRSLSSSGTTDEKTTPTLRQQEKPSNAVDQFRHDGSSNHNLPPPLPPKIAPVRTDAPYTIVHSLTTRFMLGQTGQPVLARARYLLFETFCQPTVKHQTVLEAASHGYDLSWFVLADPGLDPEILRDLKALLDDRSFPEGNAYLVLTDNPSWAADGVGVPNVTSYGAGFQELARGIRDGSLSVATGNATRLVRILEENIEGRRSKTGIDENNDKPLLLIESMLDADDGLNNRAIEMIQDLAVSHSQQQQALEVSKRKPQTPADGIAPTLNSTWWLLCGTDHIEWHNRDVYRLTQQQYQRDGISSGIIGLRQAPQYCASAGFTRVGVTTEPSQPQQPPLVFPQVAYSNHALATEDFVRCSSEPSGNTTLSRCFRRDFAGIPFVLKGRTITSDSMDHMGDRNEDYRDLPWEDKAEHPLLGLEDGERMWEVATRDFSIDRPSAQRTSVYLHEHLTEILKENHDSRCAPGFPCREVATVAFNKMIRNVKLLNKANKRNAKLQGGR